MAASQADAGLRLCPALASTRPITQAQRRVLHEPAINKRAHALDDEIQQFGGAEVASDIVEAAAFTENHLQVE